MSSIDTLFVLILKFSLVSFVLLGIGAIAMRCFGQPLERIRISQVTLSLVFCVAVAGKLGWIPVTEIAWLPSDNATIVLPSHQEGIGVDSGPIDRSLATSEPDSTVEFGLTKPTTLASGNRSETADAPDLPAARKDAPKNSSEGGAYWNAVKLLVVFAFVAISAAQAIYFLFGYFVTYRLVSTATPLQLPESQIIEEFRRDTSDNRVRLAVSERISVPIASGIFRSSIVLPKPLVEGTINPLRIRHSLDHEWKHIEQGDLVTWQLVSLAQILLWPQPFYWILRRELRLSQDQLADDFATRVNQQHVEYASTLVEFSKDSRTVLLGALTMAGTKSNLYRRVEMLLNSRFKVIEKSRKRIVLGFAGAVASVGILLTSFHLTQASDSTPAVSQDTQETKAAEIVVDTKPAEHSGYVVDALNDKPVGNATVIVTRMRSDTWQEIEVTESKTDESGKFTFSIPVEQLNQKYLYIMFDLRHETYAPRHCGSYSYGMIRKNLQLGAQPWFKKLTMVPGEKISGRFVDSQGNPVIGAAVRVRSKNELVEGFTGQSNTSTFTDDNGRFEAIVSAEGNASISVIPLNQCMKHIDLGQKRGNLEDVILADGLSVSGVVLDALGKPMNGLWVNWRESEPEGPASYEARRSSQTDDDGRFSTRPLKPGKYIVAIETKAAGALEKEKYGNFGDVPPPAVFINQTIEVTTASKEKPFVFQAVPHIYISGQCYNSEGEFTRCHLPSLTGKLNGQWMQFHSTKGDQLGQFHILAPHGIKDSDLRFITNEHTGLTIQFEGKEPSPIRDYRYEILEEDITNIKVVRYVAPIVQVKLVDASGKPVTKAVVVAEYSGGAKDTTMMYSMSSSHFEKQDNGIYRSSSLVPGMPFQVVARSEGFETAHTPMTMAEGENKTITLELKTKATQEVKSPSLSSDGEAE